MSFGKVLPAEFNFGRNPDWKFRPDTNEVVIGGALTRLEPQAASVLQALADAGGAVVSRQELLDQCWPAGKGSDEALSQAVAQLRRAFGDSRAEPQFIATVPKRGYRWLAGPLDPGDGNGVQSPFQRGTFRLRTAALLAGAGAIILMGFAASRYFYPEKVEIRSVVVLQNGVRTERTERKTD